MPLEQIEVSNHIISEGGITVQKVKVPDDSKDSYPPSLPVYRYPRPGIFTTPDAAGTPHLTEGPIHGRSVEEVQPREVPFSELNPQDISDLLTRDWVCYPMAGFDAGILETYHLDVENAVFIAVDKDNLPWTLAIDKRGVVTFFSGRGYEDAIQLRGVDSVEFYGGKDPAIKFLNPQGESYRISQQGRKHTIETRNTFASTKVNSPEIDPPKFTRY